MSYSDIEKALELAVQAGEEPDFTGKQPLARVQAAESALGLKLPQSYKEFLLQLGCGDVAGQEFYGVLKDDFSNSGVPDAIWLTLQERKDANLPDNLLIVGSQGDGAYYALDCDKVDDNGESPVIVWWPYLEMDNSEQLAKAEVLAPDFGSFFLDSIKSMLQ